MEGLVVSLSHEGECLPADCAHLQNCSENFQPVCGSDFETYWNLCVLRQHQCKERSLRTPSGPALEMLFAGDCTECIARCTDQENRELVCDSLGDTHTLCQFRMASCVYAKKFGLQLAVEYHGQCCPDPNACPPPSAQDPPLCDNNGVAHPTQCAFTAAACHWERRLRQGRLGRAACPSQPPASVHSDLVIDAFAATQPKSPAQSKPSQAQGEELAFPSLVQVLAPPPTPQPSSLAPIIEAVEEASLESPSVGCPNVCAQLYQPVCGSDGRSFINACFLESAACAERETSGVSKLVELYAGRCCEVKCPSSWRPVCDSQGDTHANLCEFGVARCLAVRRDRKTLDLTSLSVCEESPCRNLTCPRDYQPVCGSDDRTYINVCELSRAVCFAQGAGRNLELGYEGECCRADCPLDYAPVCDSRGATHSSRCALNVAICKARQAGESLELAYSGVCCGRPCGSKS